MDVSTLIGIVMGMGRVVWGIGTSKLGNVEFGYRAWWNHRGGTCQLSSAHLKRYTKTAYGIDSREKI